MAVLPPPAPGCASCAARDAVIAEQGQAIEELRADVVTLAAEVRELRRRLGRNSGNSSMPPSSDDLPGKVPPKRERRGRGSGRSRGKQPGAPGTSMTWAEPDEVIDHRPAGACGCGADLARAADLGVARSYQQLEVPLVTARRVQHDLHQARCGCGAVHAAARPAGGPDSAVSIGPNLRALTVYLVVYQHVPLGRRTLESFRDFGILPGFGGVVVSDRYACYFHPSWEKIAGNQACLAHLVRDYEDAAESYPGAVWPAQAQRALRGLIRAWHAARDAGQPEIPPHIADPLLHEFRHAVLAGLSSVPRIPGPKNTTAQHPGRDLLEFCSGRQADVTRFCSDTRIWPTSNISERGVRPVKTQQKISGRLTSEDITQDRLDIRSYIDTARKHDRNVMDVLRTAMTGAPWHPPDPAPA